MQERQSFFKGFSFVGIAAALIFSVMNAVMGNLSLCAAELAAALLAAANLAVYYRKGNYRTATRVVLLIMLALLAKLFASGGIEGTGIFWAFTFPILAFFLTGLGSGVGWMLLLLLVLAVMSALGSRGLVPVHYTMPVVRQLVASLLAVTAMTYMYELVVERYKARMEQRNTELQREVVERRKLAEELARALRAEKQFLASITHEIRTPLNSLLGFIEMVGGTPLDEIQKGYLKNAEASSRHLMLLINDILDFSKIEAGQLDFSGKPFDLREQILECAAIVSPRTAQGVQMKIEVPEFARDFHGDPMRIKQLFLNLLGNAVKFTASGTIRLYLHRAEETGDHTKLTFAVEDTGIGIPADKLEAIFEPFRQAHEGNYGGTGLGLYLSRTLARMMGGEVEVESAPGAGSRFLITLDLRNSDKRAPRAERPEQAAPGGSFSDLRILVVEDVEMNALLTREMLRRYFEASIDIVTDGGKAVEKAKEGYDIIFMDIRMPVMDGIAASRAIREFERDTLIYAMTANAFADDVESALAAGMNGYITKPVQRADLEEALQAAGARTSRSGDAPSREPGLLERLQVHFVREVGEEHAGELVGLAVENVGELLEKMEKSLAAGEEPKALAPHLHSLRGVLLNCGLEALGADAGELEELAGSSNELGALREKTQRLLSALRDLAPKA